MKASTGRRCGGSSLGASFLPLGEDYLPPFSGHSAPCSTSTDARVVHAHHRLGNEPGVSEVKIVKADSEPISTAQIRRDAETIARAVMESISRGDIVTVEYINQQSAARYCGFSEQYFNKLCRTGQGPRHLRIGTRWRSRRAWLDEWMEAGGPNIKAACKPYGR